MGFVDERALRELLAAVADGTVSPLDAAAQLRDLPFRDLGFAKVDHHRPLRVGMPEAVYAPGKTPEQCIAIVGELLSAGDGPVLLTRADQAVREAVMGAHPSGRTLGATVTWRSAAPRREQVVVAVAGTADLPVADECEAVLDAFGFSPRRLADVGVAGLHRLLAHRDELAAADAVVVIAGMEGALASVVGGLVPAPVIAVPTSAGYGASFAGITALLAMLASCAQGITVVGIDNGFGAASAVARLCNQRAGRA
jgi:NCAIR mutase (PurE)-related protein